MIPPPTPLFHPPLFADSVLQANSLARHFVLQQYQQSAIEGQSVGHSANPLLESTKSTSTRNAGGVRNRKWNRPFPRRSAERDKESADDETTRAAMEDCEETPVILSARIEAVEKLLETAPIAAVGSSSGGAGSVEGKEDVVSFVEGALYPFVRRVELVIFVHT